MVSAAGSLRNERSTCLSFSHRNRPDAIISTRVPPWRQLGQREVARYETLQIVPPVSSVMNSEPSGACASPTGRRTGFAPAPPGLGLNPSANVVNDPVGRLDRKGANTTRNPAWGSGARFHEP